MICSALGKNEKKQIKKQDTYSKQARTYMYFDGEVRFPFGYGLSYTTYEYSNLKLEKDALDANESLKVSVDVANTGSMAGREIVELYIRRVFGEREYNNKPKRQLKAWAKVELQPGEKKTVTMEIPMSEVTFWSNRLKKMVVEEGNYLVEVGPDSSNLPCSAPFAVSGAWNPGLANVYAVADVDANGVITAMGAGTALITVSVTVLDRTMFCEIPVAVK